MYELRAGLLYRIKEDRTGLDFNLVFGEKF